MRWEWLRKSRRGSKFCSLKTTDGSCGRQEEYDFLVLVHGNLWPGSGRTELSTMATQYWAEGVLTGKWLHEQKEGWMRQIQEVQTWKQVRGPAGAVMCETRDLGIKWPHWHTLMFSDEIKD